MTTKIALITGAAIGIGRATAFKFADNHYHVVVTDILSSEGEAVAETIRQRGGSADYYDLDVSDTANVNDLCDRLDHQFGSLSAVINNAGIAHKQPLQTLSDEQWDLTMEIDLKGMMRVTRAANKLLERDGNGAVVCLSSIAGANVGWAEHIPYSAAKGGVTGLVKGLAIELADKNIRVNGIAPGLIRTAQSLNTEHSVGPEGLEAMTPGIPLGRIGSPEDIANVIAFLASEDAAYMTGQILTVDGGLTVSL